MPPCPKDTYSDIDSRFGYLEVHTSHSHFPIFRQIDWSVSTNIMATLTYQRFMVRQWILFAFVMLLSFAPPPLAASPSNSAQNPGRILTESQWYTRYPMYPPYCATPQEMATRKVPPLAQDKRFGETRLKYVTAILRHGSRTPYKAGLNCWDGYDTLAETSVWDCNLTAYLTPPPPDAILREEGHSSTTHDEAMFLFEKRYDALTDPANNLSNHLRGTCQLGQLLLQGYEQEFLNGQFLRDAYVYDETAYNHDPRMRLLDISKTRKTSVWEDIYYRVDDESRTLLSGQVVLRGLFGPELDAYFGTHQRYPVIPLHTADYDRDILFPNHERCPRLIEMWERSQSSPGFQALNQSKEAVLLRQFQQEVLRVPQRGRDMDAIDCIMTTMCTDRPLPEAINDYRGDARDTPASSPWSDIYGTDLLQRLYDFETALYVYNLQANDGEYAKLAMNPLLVEIMGKVYPHVHSADTTGLPKLSLFSGHDTTILPLLASIGAWNDTEWVPYASMVLIELHELNVDGSTDKNVFPLGFAFRLIYNGEVITHRIKECPSDSELCDANVLIDYALQEANCDRKYPDSVPYKDAITRTKEIVSTSEGVLYFLLVVSVSACIGGTLVYIYLIHCCPHVRYDPTSTGEEEEDDGIHRINGNGYRDRNAEYSSESSNPTELS
jgi:Histidine phosphatase superfamily (branch 2)